MCLQLLLKYPAPEAPHGPHTFVDDAMYLREHLDAAGGSTLITKYTGKSPQAPSSAESGTKTFRGINVKAMAGKSPMSSPAKFIQQQGMESILQGAKGVLERGEKLGINQAVRDAMGEIRRNMQTFNEARQGQRLTTSAVSDEDAAKTLAAMELRNKHLASLLDETVANLKTMSAGKIDGKAKSLELIEIAAAKIQFVQIYLEDSTMDVPVFVAPEETRQAQEKPGPKQVEKEEKPSKKTDTPKIVKSGGDKVATPIKPSASATDKPLPAVVPEPSPAADNAQSRDKQDKGKASQENGPKPGTPVVEEPASGQAETRPAPVPTRSTLAQSSFSWMLEPDQSTPQRNAPAGSKSPPSSQQQQHKKRNSNNLNRERNAFLFGDDGSNEGEGASSPKNNDIFGMEALPKPKSKLQGSLLEGE